MAESSDTREKKQDTCPKKERPKLAALSFILCDAFGSGRFRATPTFSLKTA
jgi:hypothetical protein